MSAPTVPLAAKKPARGALRVKVTGTGSYTLRAKGYRKTGTATRTFRVKPGKYTVKAPGATVKPKKAVRVRNGKTATVRVRFPKTTPAPGPEPKPPVQPPVTGPVSQWVQAGTEATVSTAGGYVIHVPAGVLQQSANVSITPLEALPGDLPGADFRIDGAWTGAVQVTLPVPDAADDPVVLHEGVDSLQISSGAAVQRASSGGIPVATVWVTSLSSFYAAAVDCSEVSETAGSLLCKDQSDASLAGLFSSAGTAAGQGVSLSATQVGASGLSSDCPNSYQAMVSSGDLAKGISCSESLATSQGSWAFTNHTHANYIGLFAAGAVYSMSVTGTFDRSVERPSDIPLIMLPLFDSLTKGYLFPEQKTTIKKSTGSGVSTLRTEPDPGMTPLWASVGFLTSLVGGELIDKMVADPKINLASKLTACVPAGSTSLSSTMVNCLKNAVVEGLWYYAKHSSLKNRARVAGTLAKVLAAGDLLMIGQSFWLALQAKIGSGLENRLTIEMR